MADSVAALDRISIAAIGGTAAELASEARAAEEAGIECLWAPELFRSSVTQATYLGAITERIQVGTGIAWAFTRSPFILAISALDIDEISGGRFRLGLGAGVKRLNETWHGVEYGRPAPHLKESIEAVRLIMQQAHRGEPIRFQGSYHDIDIKGWVRPHPPVRESVPIYTAAVREGMARMAGDVADGLIGHPMCSMRWLEEVLIANFETGLQRSGRSRSDLDFIPTVCCAISDDERGGPRRRPPDDLLLRDGAHLHAAVGAARLRRGRGRGRRRPFAPATWRRCPATSRTRWSTPTRPPAPSTRCASASRRWPSARDGVFLTPPDLLPRAGGADGLPAADHRGVRPGRAE